MNKGKDNKLKKRRLLSGKGLVCKSGKRGEELSLLGFGLGRRREERREGKGEGIEIGRRCGGDVVFGHEAIGFGNRGKSVDVNRLDWPQDDMCGI